MSKRVCWLVLGIVFGALWVGCHADPNDPAGQAKELSDPVRRQNAIVNLERIYSTALAEQKGDRNAPQVKAVDDVIWKPLTDAYVQHPEDVQNGQAILDLLKEMQDPRTLPALIKALDWRTEVSEEHAIRAAQALQNIDVPQDKKGDVINALSDAIEKVEGSRPIDNRMRIEFLRALGHMNDKAAAPVLVKVMTRQSEDQAFPINRLAAEQLGELGVPSAVPDLIRALFLFDPNNPASHMNDVATEALVRIGRPAYQPLLDLLNGKNKAANDIAKANIEAIKARNPQQAAQMSVKQVTSSEAMNALGALGFADALDPLLAQAHSHDIGDRMNAILALTRLNLAPAQESKVLDAMKEVYKDAPVGAKPQLLAAGLHRYDASLLPFFLSEASNTDNQPTVRIEAVQAYSQLADKSEAAAMRTLIAKEPKSEDGGYKEEFAKNEPMLSAAEQCDHGVSCWIKKLGDKNALVQQKAAFMLGRLARGNSQAIAALVGPPVGAKPPHPPDPLNSPDIKVRFAALNALDHIADKGSPEAVKKIEAMKQQQEGRAIWTQFAMEALPIEARLRTRAAG